jgi:Asp-tRNA(Asn)/Glu-tRNA(Gln) amidotransferase C subunit
VCQNAVLQLQQVIVGKEQHRQLRKDAMPQENKRNKVQKNNNSDLEGRIRDTVKHG